jgi:hypothetical protein
MKPKLVEVSGATTFSKIKLSFIYHGLINVLMNVTVKYQNQHMNYLALCW